MESQVGAVHGDGPVLSDCPAIILMALGRQYLGPPLPNSLRFQHLHEDSPVAHILRCLGPEMAVPRVSPGIVGGSACRTAYDSSRRSLALEKRIDISAGNGTLLRLAYPGAVDSLLPLPRI